MPKVVASVGLGTSCAAQRRYQVNRKRKVTCHLYPNLARLLPYGHVSVQIQHLVDKS